MWKEFGVTNSFTFESSFYGYKLGNSIVVFKFEDFFEIAATLMRSLLEYHYLLKGIEFELKISHGWLKPSQLKALTGKPAVEILEKKME